MEIDALQERLIKHMLDDTKALATLTANQQQLLAAMLRVEVKIDEHREVHKELDRFVTSTKTGIRALSVAWGIVVTFIGWLWYR